MPLAPSSLSRACRSVADFLTAGLSTAGETVEVLVGTPAAAAAMTQDALQRVNLFFYGIEPSGFDSHTLPAEPWRVRLRCLITPFGIDEQGISAGENDLRLLGDVIRLLHEQPILPEVGVNGTSARLHAVFAPLDLDGLNRLWTTQGDVSLRPSVTYEIALAPIVPSKLAIGAPVVGAIGVGIRPDTDDLAQTSSDQRSPDVPVMHVDARRGDWTPQVCFVQSGACTYVLAFGLGSASLASFQPEVWIAGVPNAAVSLDWEQWDSQSGWQAGPSTPATASSDTIDPSQAASATLVAATLPWTDRPGQFTLYASRQWGRPDRAQISLRSNPLLVTLHA
jgi:hypothetical protein